MKDLIERLEKLTGPDHELDRLIHFRIVAPWLAEKCVDWVSAAFEGPRDFLWWTAETKAEGKEGYHDSWDSVTSSVDAALEFLNTQLPHWRVENLCEWEAAVLRDRGPWTCDLVSVQKPGEARQHAKCAHAVNPAVALCIAILTAKEQS